MGCSGSKVSVVAPDTLAAVGPVDIPTVLSLENSFHARYHVYQKLGKGSFAQVHRVRRIGDEHKDEDLAVKITDIRQQDPGGVVGELDLSRRTDFEREVRFLRKVRIFTSCLQLVESILETDFSYIIVERCDCTLTHYFTRVIPFVNELSLFRVFKDMLQGIVDIHSVHVVHRDIKADNYMVKNGVVKLCDFGFADTIPVNQTKSSRCGTAPYMSPEMLTKQRYSLKTDVWSFTVIVYVMLCGKFPYQPDSRGSAAIYHAIINATPEPTFSPSEGLPHISERVQRFIRAVFSRCPSSRMDAKGVLEELSNCMDSGELEEHVCLRPTLESARKVGAMTGSRRKIENDTFVDEMLRNIQEKNLNIDFRKKQEVGPKDGQRQMSEPPSPRQTVVRDVQEKMSEPVSPTAVTNTLSRKSTFALPCVGSSVYSSSNTAGFSVFRGSSSMSRTCQIPTISTQASGNTIFAMIPTLPIDQHTLDSRKRTRWEEFKKLDESATRNPSRNSTMSKFVSGSDDSCAALSSFSDIRSDSHCLKPTRTRCAPHR